jgi:hypothetical protein
MSTIVDLPYEIRWEALDWALKNCPSYITNTAVRHDRDTFFIRYYFGNEHDALAFRLRWPCS